MRRAVLSLAGLSGLVFAHPGHFHGENPFTSGLLHPLSGVDHLTIALAVGLWGAYALGRRGIFPVIAFLSGMILGAASGLGGVALPYIEYGVLASLLVMGIMLLSGFVSFRVSLPLILLFGFVHGNLHGIEAPVISGGEFYLLGLTLSTALLHFAGLLAGTHTREAGAKLAGALLVLLAFLL
ncbi:MAG: urease accessory protein [Aquificae bacterium]|nr:urease accessory protein [Aquificota bacterium]